MLSDIVNPGDKEHAFTKIRKVVSGQDAPTLATVAAVYGSVVTAGVHRAATIKVADPEEALHEYGVTPTPFDKRNSSFYHGNSTVSL